VLYLKSSGAWQDLRPARASSHAGEIRWSSATRVRPTCISNRRSPQRGDWQGVKEANRSTRISTGALCNGREGSSSMRREARVSTHTHLCERNPHGGVAKMIIEGVQHGERGELCGIAREREKNYTWVELCGRSRIVGERARTKEWSMKGEGGCRRRFWLFV
jgi:hypothetical protein